MSFYMILDNHLERIGILDNDHPGATPFYGDMVVKQLADEGSTYDINSVRENVNANSADLNANNKNWNHYMESIYVPYNYPDTYKIAIGNHLAFQDPDNLKYYVFRINSVTDSVDAAGNHYKQATAINLAIWKLGKTVPRPKEIKHANSRIAFTNLLASTGWYLDTQAPLVGGSHDITFDGTSSAQSLLQNFCSMYGAEIDAFVHFSQSWKVTTKRIEIYRHIGKDNGQRVEYARNITGISRNMIDDNLYTKLFVYGVDGSTCANNKNGNQNFVYDDAANAKYNPADHGQGATYLEGAISSNLLKDPYALYNWGARQLKIFNHPRANYTVDIDNNLDAHLGDTIRVLDLEMQPELTVEARVIQKRTSFSDFSQNQIILGEFTTVNVIPPSFIKNMLNSFKSHLAELLDLLRKNPNALSAVIDKPNGTSWKDVSEVSKQFIAHISVMGEDISTNIKPSGYIWELLQDGVSMPGFLNDPAHQGQTISLSNHETGELRLSIDTSAIADIPEITFDNSTVDSVWTIDQWRDAWGDKRSGAIQYVQYSQDEDCYYVSNVYNGSQDKTKYNGQNMSSMISRVDKNGNLKDSMVLIGSRHNANFGLQSANGTHYIWTTVYQEADRGVTYVARIPYRPNAVISNDKSNYETFLAYPDKYLSTNYDPSSNKVMVNRFNGAKTTEIYSIDELFNHRQAPTPEYSFNRVDFGFTPKSSLNDNILGTGNTTDTTSNQTFQSASLKFPYYYFDSGDANMSDERTVYCINVINKTLVFKQSLNIDMFSVGNYDFFEPETIGWTMENGHPVFLFSANYNTDNPKYVDRDIEGKITKKRHISSLWKVNYLERALQGTKVPVNGGDTTITN